MSLMYFLGFFFVCDFRVSQRSRLFGEKNFRLPCSSTYTRVRNLHLFLKHHIQGWKTHETFQLWSNVGHLQAPNKFFLSFRNNATSLKAKVQSPLTKIFSHRCPSQVNVKEPVKEHLWDLHFAEFGRLAMKRINKILFSFRNCSFWS